ELVERLRAADRHAIDAERGRAIGADLVGHRDVLVDLRRELLGGERFLELCLVDAGFAGPLLEVLRGQRLLVGERGVVELPERFTALETEHGLSRFSRGARS